MDVREILSELVPAFFPTVEEAQRECDQFMRRREATEFVAWYRKFQTEADKLNMKSNPQQRD